MECQGKSCRPRFQMKVLQEEIPFSNQFLVKMQTEQSPKSGNKRVIKKSLVNSRNFDEPKSGSRMIRTLKTHRPSQLNNVLGNSRLIVGGIFKELNSRKGLQTSSINKSYQQISSSHEIEIKGEQIKGSPSLRRHTSRIQFKATGQTTL